jgi:hypothetical protein
MPGAHAAHVPLPPPQLPCAPLACTGRSLADLRLGLARLLAIIRPPAWGWQGARSGASAECDLATCWGGHGGMRHEDHCFSAERLTTARGGEAASFVAFRAFAAGPHRPPLGGAACAPSALTTVGEFQSQGPGSWGGVPDDMTSRRGSCVCSVCLLQLTNQMLPFWARSDDPPLGKFSPCHTDSQEGPRHDQNRTGLAGKAPSIPASLCDCLRSPAKLAAPKLPATLPPELVIDRVRPAHPPICATCSPSAGGLPGSCHNANCPVQPQLAGRPLLAGFCSGRTATSRQWLVAASSRARPSSSRGRGGE